MADLFTPETATWGTPAMPSSRRGMNFTKEDLLAALVQSQNQPQGFGGEFLGSQVPQGFGGQFVGASPNREQQFQQDWDAAMQAYEQGVAHPKTTLPGFTYEGKTSIEHTPEELFNQTIAPLRFRAAEFSPGITSAFGQKSLMDYHNQLAAHQKVLEKNAEARAKHQDIMDTLAQRREARLGGKPTGFKFYDQSAVDFLRDNPWSAPDFEQQYGPGSSQRALSGGFGSQATAKPLPSSKDDLVVGQTYITKRGVATWNGTKFVQ